MLILVWPTSRELIPRYGTRNQIYGPFTLLVNLLSKIFLGGFPSITVMDTLEETCTILQWQ